MHVGAEYRSFLLYWGPVVLKGILTDDRYFHFLLLSSAITLFLGLSITEDDVQLGEEMITTYLTMYPGLYGKSLVLEAKVTIESGGGEKRGRKKKKIIDFEKKKRSEMDGQDNPHTYSPRRACQKVWAPLDRIVLPFRVLLSLHREAHTWNTVRPSSSKPVSLSPP